MNYIEKLNWRYATKRMNGNKIPSDKLQRILDAIRLAPSSLGLQPFQVIIVEDSELRKKINVSAINQPQIEESSAVLIFAHNLQLSVEHADQYMERIQTTRGVTSESLSGFRKAVVSAIESRNPAEFHAWSARQAYIALGVGVVASALENVDATPMEGFSPDKLDEALGLTEKNLRSVVLLALGYRNEELDSLAKAKKVRKSESEFYLRF